MLTIIIIKKLVNKLFFFVSKQDLTCRISRINMVECYSEHSHDLTYYVITCMNTWQLSSQVLYLSLLLLVDLSQRGILYIKLQEWLWSQTFTLSPPDIYLFLHIQSAWTYFIQLSHDPFFDLSCFFFHGLGILDSVLFLKV